MFKPINRTQFAKCVLFIVPNACFSLMFFFESIKQVLFTTLNFI